MTKCLLSLFLVFFSFSNSYSQTDTSFWFVAPDISVTMGESPIVLHLTTYDQPTIVYVRQPAFTGSATVNTSVSINANSVFTINLTSYVASLESAPVNSVSSRGLYISSKEFISAYYTLGSANNKEIVSLKGQSALGTDFYTPIPNSPALLTSTLGDAGVGFDILATKPGTTLVLITPKAACIGRTKNITFAKFLTQGQTFSVQDNKAVSPSELAGSIISSDKDICVTVKGAISNGTLICPTYYTDQILPSDKLGKDYVIYRGNGTSDFAYMLSPQNATSFTISTATGTVASLMNAGETYSLSNTAQITYVHTDKPIYLFHLTGYGCNLSGGILAPVYCAGSYSVSFPRLSADSLCLDICIRSGNESSFTLQSGTGTVAVPASAFSVVPGTAGDLVAARIFYASSVIPVGSYNILSNSTDLFALSVHNGGTAGRGGYAMASNFYANPFVKANIAPTATICANTQFTLNGQVGGGPNTGLWSLVNGYGTFSAGNTQLTNNLYIPGTLDTTNNSSSSAANKYVKIVLKTTGVCPSITDTLRLHVKQPPIVEAGTNSVVCGNQKLIRLNGNVYGATNQGVWNIVAPASGSFVAGALTFTPVYKFSSGDTSMTYIEFELLSLNNGVCNAERDTVQIYINKPPIVDAGPVSTVVCSNNSTLALNGIVSGTASSTGAWLTSGTGLFTPNNLSLNGNYIPSGNDMITQSIWLYLVSTNNGICNPTRDSMQVYFTEPAIVNAGSDVNACSNAPFALLSGAMTGTTVGQVAWLGGNGTFQPSSSVLTPTYTGSAAEIAAGFVTLTLTTINNGLCFATEDVVKVNFQRKPIANFSVNPVCLGQESRFEDKSLNLSGTGQLIEWQWRFGDNSAGAVVSDPLHTYGNAGTYTTQLIVKSSFNCYDTIMKTAIVNAIPTASFETSRDCNGSAQQVNFVDKSSVPPPDQIPANGYYWDFGGFGFSFAKDTAVTFPSDGIYTILHRVNSGVGCQSVFSQTVEIKPRPVARFLYLNNSSIGFGADVQFRDTSSNAVKWKWDFGNGQTSTTRHPAIHYEENGRYPVILAVNDEFGCVSTYSMEVKVANVVAEISKLVPNMITPNNDGKNDYWRLDFIDVFFPKAEIEIFNRWGTRLFYSQGYSNAWDGSYKGEPLPVGVYFYVINLNDGESTPIKGTITLMK